MGVFLIRLFAALPVPPHIASVLTDLQRGLTGASWRPRENFHITLRFFGDVTHDLATELDRDIAQIPAPPLQLELQGCGRFGKREPRAVWAGVRETPELTRLANACEQVARRHGLPAEKRPFRPHVTLAYCHGTTPEEADSYVADHMTLEAGPWTSDRFHLYSSHFGRGPSRYIPEAEYPME